MPKIQRSKLPEELFRHLVRRVKERSITKEDLFQVLHWIEENPSVPSGAWYKRFKNVTVCGRDSLIKTFLSPDQVPIGTEVS